MKNIRVIEDQYRDATASRVLDQTVAQLKERKTLHVSDGTKEDMQRLYSRLRSQGWRLRYQWQNVDGVDGYTFWAIPEREVASESEQEPERVGEQTLS